MVSSCNAGGCGSYTVSMAIGYRMVSANWSDHCLLAVSTIISLYVRSRSWCVVHLAERIQTVLCGRRALRWR